MILVNLLQDKIDANKYISSTLIQEIEKTLQKKKKVILYLNKRGSHNSLICKNCHHLFECSNCDISLSVHTQPKSLACHVCQNIYQYPKACPQCGMNELLEIGVGTQQIEDFCKHYFPTGIHVFRFDTDVVKNKTQKQEALKNLENADIIIGTKMITTGFDFENIGLIGVILLEQELQIPAFNTKEKLFSNIRQLLGRGNRKGNNTDIVIQSAIPENDVIDSLTHKNYKQFFQESLQERKLFYYPPFCEMLTLEYRHKEKEKALLFIKKIQEKLAHNIKGKNIELLLSQTPQRKHNQYHYKLIIKGKNLREFLHCIQGDIFKNKALIVNFEN